eukprot:gnl/Chilomastix_cuspidata/1000.p1 GENE.gnl/Chilomastix_cuspidata/1000~~gnl/Chilomastix_cuspidata/1000.p1  ORF type:complete len:215 (+),score=128.18 gnl/Chilomastix_cuspidata/1000:255-899(+)
MHEYQKAEKYIRLAESSAPQKGTNIDFFKLAVFKLRVIVLLLQGKVPPLDAFEAFEPEKVRTVRRLSGAVLGGDTDALNQIISEAEKQLRHEQFLNLALRLPRALVRVTIRNCAKVFSTVSLAEVAKRTCLSDAVAALWAVAEAVERGDISATVDLASMTVSFSDAVTERRSAHDELRDIMVLADDMHRAALKGLVFAEDEKCARDSPAAAEKN